MWFGNVVVGLWLGVTNLTQSFLWNDLTMSYPCGILVLLAHTLTSEHLVHHGEL